MSERWCNACGQTFLPRPQSPRQTYCPKASCQKARKLLWQRTKRRSDQDYIANQSKANAAWARRNPDYWRRYRAHDLSLPSSLQQLADALSAALTKLLEESSIADNASSRNSVSERPPSARRAHTQPSALVFTLTIEVQQPQQKSSAKTRQETTR